MKKKIALFIDCENVSYKYIDTIINRLSKLGDVFIKKVYGDWNNSSLKKWNELIHNYSLESIHQTPYSSTKNSTDIKMTVDIMKVLCSSKNIDYMALVTSDSDFTPLITEIKSQEINVIGFGEKKANKALKNVCTEFIELGEKENNKQKSNNRNQKSILLKNVKLINRIKHTINNVKYNDHWALVSVFGIFFKDNYYSTAKDYGNYQSWTELLKDIPSVIDVEYIESNSNRNIPVVSIR